MLRTVLYFVGFLYWPLFFIGVRSLYFRCEITGKKLGASLFLAAGAAPLFDAWIRDCSCHIDALARKSTTRRTKIKVIALSAYLYIFWQMLPEINLYVVTADLAAVAAIFMVGRARKHKAKDAVSKGPISKLWE